MTEQLIIDIVYFLVHYVVQVFLFHFYYTLMLTPKNNLHRFLVLFAFPLANAALSYILIEAELNIFAYFFIMGLTILPVFICFKEPKRYCFFSAIIQYTILCLVDAVYSSIVLEALGYFATKLETKTWVSVMMSLLFYVIFSIIMLGVIILWRKKVRKLQIKSIGLFMLFPLGQLLFLSACTFPTWTGDFQIFSNGFVVIAFIVSLLSDIVMFYALRESSRIEEMKIRMMEMEHSLEMQYQYYESIMKKQDEVREYRHDINNLVATVEALVEKNISLAEGAAMAEELKEKTKNMTIPLFCSNPIVNTVLWQKNKEAIKQGTNFIINIKPEEDFPIDRIDACSLFANLLDNAIRETSEFENSVISVTAARKIGLLFIEISNTSDKEFIFGKDKLKTTKQEKNHGHGIEIVQKIVEKYDGSFIFKGENGIATAKISLIMKDEERINADNATTV